MTAVVGDAASARSGGPTLTLRSHGSAGWQVELAPHLFLVMQAGCNRVAPLRIRLCEVDEVNLSRAGECRVEVHSDGLRCRVEIGVADSWMSSNHATLVRDAAGWRLVDRGSKNGSRVDGQRQPSAVLRDGAVIELGRTFFLFRAALPTPGDAPRWVDAGKLEAGGGLATMLPELARQFAELARLAASKSSLVIRGPTGSGKELIARAVHALSGRRGRFVAVNCAALPEALVESELFGHVRGAFSGAARDHKGLVEVSGGGTLFLDEIGDLPAQAQSKLLRALQEQAVRPVGGDAEIAIDLRVIAATHRDLEALVAAGGFREDLLARLGGGFELPPLCERREDLGLIINGLLGRIEDPRASRAELSSEAVRALFQHAWPRNIRELQKGLEQAIALAQDAPIELGHLPGELRRARSQPAARRGDPALLGDEDRARRAQLLELLRTQRGNVAAVARELQTVRSQVQRWIQRYEIARDDWAS
ncbi:MAG TPA: sigma 54-interacting transcriptional regulator [Kofleriaceae bacterium]|jgi:DNA-binding NtrC family response regulator|nr:sigma 54-interacting transcriptional regulator [Kofleriaceae bacterium]